MSFLPVEVSLVTLSPLLAFSPGFSTVEKFVCLSPQALRGGTGGNTELVSVAGRV